MNALLLLALSLAEEGSGMSLDEMIKNDFKMPWEKDLEGEVKTDETEGR